MNTLCPVTIGECDCFDSNPLKLISSEAPDLLPLTGVSYNRTQPPLGYGWATFTGIGLFYSGTSQADADQQAYILGYQASICTWTNPDGSMYAQYACPAGVTFFNQAVPGGGSGGSAGGGGGGGPSPQPGQFLSSAQTGIAGCPDGSTFDFFVPAGLFSASTQIAADEAAFAFASQQASDHKICLGNIPSQCCLNTATSINVVATGNFLAQPPSGDFWALVGGGLPPGLVFNGGTITGGVATITGTPTAIGSYSFVISVTDPVGDTMQKTYTLTVASVTGSPGNGQIGVAYSAGFSANGIASPAFGISGSAPNGLGINSSTGVLSGTPTVAGTFNFSVTAHDGVTGQTCSAPFSITIFPANIFLGLAWGSASIFTSGGAGGTINSSVFSQNTGTMKVTSNGPAGSFADAKIQGTLSFTGPLLNFNLALTLAFSVGGGGGQVIVTQGGITVLDTLTDTTAGVTNYPFTIQAGTTSAIVVTVFDYSGTNFNQTTVQINITSVI